jgi:hypothetical protein
MQLAIHGRIASRRRNHAIAGREKHEAAGGDALPCPNPKCRAPGWPLAAKPLNWPWAEHCWNCDVELR